MDFIYDIDLISGFARRVVDPLTEVADILYTGVTGGVNLDDIQGSPPGYCLTYGASVTRLILTIVGKAVYCFG
jgi:hypothetical protein